MLVLDETQSLGCFTHSGKTNCLVIYYDSMSDNIIEGSFFYSQMNQDVIIVPAPIAGCKRVVKEILIYVDGDSEFDLHFMTGEPIWSFETKLFRITMNAHKTFVFSKMTKFDFMQF